MAGAERLELSINSFGDRDARPRSLLRCKETKPEVLRLFQLGLKNVEIASQLGIQTTTVSTHLASLRRAGHDLPKVRRGGGRIDGSVIDWKSCRGRFERRHDVRRDVSKA